MVSFCTKRGLRINHRPELLLVVHCRDRIPSAVKISSSSSIVVGVFMIECTIRTSATHADGAEEIIDF